jgi:hypothetical protein
VARSIAETYAVICVMLEAGQSRVVRSVVVVKVVVNVEAETEDGLSLVLFVSSTRLHSPPLGWSESGLRGSRKKHQAKK